MAEELGTLDVGVVTIEEVYMIYATDVVPHVSPVPCFRFRHWPLGIASDLERMVKKNDRASTKADL